MIGATSSSDNPLAAVLVMGASSPIGYGVRPVQAAMAGGLRNFQETSLMGGDIQDIRASRLPDVDEDAPRAERIAVLTQLAFADLLENTPVELSNNVPVFVGMAIDSPESDLKVIKLTLFEASNGQIDSTKAMFFGFSEGRIAFLSALAKAIRSFEEGVNELALVMAVDTRCTWYAIDSLMRERSLLTDRDDGTIPGEAAVIALVASPRSSMARRYARFFVASPAFGEDEPKTIRQSPQATNGLGCAFRTLREHPWAGALRPSAVIAFETGELFYTRTFTTAYLRNAELMPEPLQHELITSNLGDTGAAAGGMALVRADWMMHQLESEDEQRMLIYGHADDGRCAAAITIRMPSSIGKTK